MGAIIFSLSAMTRLRFRETSTIFRFTGAEGQVRQVLCPCGVLMSPGLGELLTASGSKRRTTASRFISMRTGLPRFPTRDLSGAEELASVISAMMLRGSHGIAACHGDPSDIHGK